MTWEAMDITEACYRHQDQQFSAMLSLWHVRAWIVNNLKRSSPIGLRHMHLLAFNVCPSIES
eukprot:3656946-Amphidinium_carterae.1